jgi:hypothetical protein
VEYQDRRNTDLILVAVPEEIRLRAATGLGSVDPERPPVAGPARQPSARTLAAALEAIHPKADLAPGDRALVASDHQRDSD